MEIVIPKHFFPSISLTKVEYLKKKVGVLNLYQTKHILGNLRIYFLHSRFMEAYRVKLGKENKLQ